MAHLLLQTSVRGDLCQEGLWEYVLRKSQHDSADERKWVG